MFHPFRIAASLMLLTTAGAVRLLAQDPADLAAMLQQRDFDGVIKATDNVEAGSALLRARAVALQQRGVARFFDARIKESIEDFDAYLTIHPEEDPFHWQRGIDYYYAGEYEKGVAQFERHQTVNTQDVENAVWHFLCAVRQKGGSVEAARRQFINIQQDSRVPMAEVHQLFAGTGSVEAVLAAAEGNSASGEELKNQRCYAHLYLGLYCEALGDEAGMKKHIALAANDYRMNHYMGKVAQVHAKLRGIALTPGDK